MKTKKLTAKQLGKKYDTQGWRYNFCDDSDYEQYGGWEDLIETDLDAVNNSAIPLIEPLIPLFAELARITELIEADDLEIELDKNLGRCSAVEAEINHILTEFFAEVFTRYVKIGMEERNRIY